ncbi:MAG TPA: hypothetical protein VF668_01195 [Pyrinomonadaceae bacterium]|jgi:predicted RNA-binding Zn-ribbon protein involved in translation (DUF1610 family)
MEEQQDKRLCGHKVKTCRKCGHRYPKAEYELWVCPECGEDRRCQDSPMDNGKCRRAGGKSLGGVASPRATTLEHSRYVPKRLRRAFKAAAENKDFLTLRTELDIIEARLDDLGRLLDENAPGPTAWGDAEKALRDFTRAQATGSVPGMQKALGELAERITTGKREADLWKETSKLQDQKARLLLSELKLMKETGKSVPIVQVMALMRRIQSIIFDKVTDREVLRHIAAEFRLLTGD